MSARPLRHLTIAAPFFQEEAGAREFHRQVSAQVDALGLSCDFVFVDDGSSDGTLRVLNEIAKEDRRVTVLALSRNFGHQTALSAALDFAYGEAVITMDSDLQHPPETIADMVEAYNRGSDIVYAVRENDDNRGKLKQLAASNFYRLFKKLTDIEVIEGAVDFRLATQDAVAAIRQMREQHRYLRGMFPWVGFSYYIVHYQQNKRQTGRSTYSWRQLARLASAGLFSFSTIPLRVITGLGLVVILLGLTYLVYVLATVIMGSAPQGWASVIVVVLFLGGVQLLSIGVLSQYIGMIFEQVKGRPLYVLKQRRMSTIAENLVAQNEPISLYDRVS